MEVGCDALEIVKVVDNLVDVVDICIDVDPIASDVEVGNLLSLLVSVSSGTIATDELGSTSIELELELVGSAASGGSSAEVGTPYLA